MRHVKKAHPEAWKKGADRKQFVDVAGTVASE
jgi:hypothetical protein